MGRAQNTENVFSADGLLPPDQKRGHILGAYNEREAAYSTEGGTQKRTLTARVGCNQLCDMLMLSIELSRVGAWSNRSVRHTLVPYYEGLRTQRL